MTSIKNIIFDLDGTLLNSSQDVIITLKKSFQLAGVIHDVQINQSHIGPPLPQMIQTICPLISESTQQEVIKHYRQLYDTQQPIHTHIYEGLVSVLQVLQKQHIQLFIATNKPLKATLHLLKHFKLDAYFIDVLTPDALANTILNKQMMINHLIQKHQLIQNQTLMVGDTIGDIVAAQQNHIYSIAFLNGYGKEEDLFNTRPTLSFHTYNNFIHQLTFL